MLVYFFNALPSELRQGLKHVRVELDCGEEALWWVRFNYIRTAVKKLEATLLESFEVVGISQHTLMRLQLWDRMDFEVQRDGAMVRVHWISVEDLES
jgi:hypothetical protein